MLCVREVPRPSGPAVSSHPVLLYDGVCGLCNRIVQFILQRDPAGTFRFAALQSDLAARILARHEAQPEKLDTVYLVLNHDSPDESLLARSDAVTAVLQRLSRGWRTLGLVFSLIPRPMRDWIYRVVARRRYSIFGRYDACPLPMPEMRPRFLDQ